MILFFHKEAERLFDQLPVYYMKILFGDFNGKVRRENILKPTTAIITLFNIIYFFVITVFLKFSLSFALVSYLLLVPILRQ